MCSFFFFHVFLYTGTLFIPGFSFCSFTAVLVKFQTFHSFVCTKQSKRSVLFSKRSYVPLGQTVERRSLSLLSLLSPLKSPPVFVTSGLHALMRFSGFPILLQPPTADLWILVCFIINNFTSMNFSPDVSLFFWCAAVCSELHLSGENLNVLVNVWSRGHALYLSVWALFSLQPQGLKGGCWRLVHECSNARHPLVAVWETCTPHCCVAWNALVLSKEGHWQLLHF